MDDAQPSPLLRGDLLPSIRVAPPGPRSREVARRLAAFEAPRVNTVGDGGEAALCWESACGANVADADGNVFIDFTSGFGVASIGHRHPDVVAALQRQSEWLIHGLGDVHPHALRAELAERLGAFCPVQNPRVFFAVSGSDAVEIALKSAMLATKKSVIIATDRAYHGLTLGALAVTVRDTFRAPFADHLHARVRRIGYGCAEEELSAAFAPGDVAAVIVEPAAGREGVIFPRAGWLATLARVARAHGALFIADEIFTGFGRTGFSFAVDADAVSPDLLCCGKALGGGFPIAAVVGRREVMDAWDRPGEALHTATFIANPLSCAAALAALEVIEGEQLAARAAKLGQRIGERLRSWVARLPAIRGERPIAEVRGRGLMWAVQPKHRPLASRWSREAMQRGVIALSGRSSLLIEPPLTITEQQLEKAMEILEEAFVAAHD